MSDHAARYTLFITHAEQACLDDGDVLAECDSLAECSARLVECDHLWCSRVRSGGDGVEVARLAVEDGDPTWLLQYEDAGFYMQRSTDGALFTMRYAGDGPFQDPALITWTQHSGSGT